MTVEAPEIIPTGSTWYAWGHHWRVESQTTKEGEPAVLLKCLTADRRSVYTLATVTVKRLERYGKENDATD